MERHALAYLKKWYSKKNKKPLIIRGARQVGKSTLVKLFSQSEKLNLIEINLEVVKLKTLIDINEGFQIENLIAEIESKFEVKISENTLLFFDEIQQQASLLQYLRYFYEKFPNYSVICAGSLLEFALESNKYSMPVGRIEYFHLSPMSFFEFLIATKKRQLLKQMTAAPYKLEAHHFEQLSESIKLYFFIGGMPEAIKTYIETKNLMEVRSVHRSIIQTYRDDFSKYSSKTIYPRIDELFYKIPQVLGKKIKYSEISSDYQSREIKKILHLLRQARLLHFCYHTNASGLPLSSQTDWNVYKMYFLDVGLLNYMMETSWTSLQDYSDASLLTKGLIAEQFAAQHLAYLRNGLEEPSLSYWLRDKKNENAEVDFIFSKAGKIYPVEIKSGKSGKIKSLIHFVSEKKIQTAYRFDLKDRSNKTEEVFEKTAHVISKNERNSKVHFDLINLHLSQIELLNDD